MDSASPADLLRLLLRRSDRHPVGTLDGIDLEGQAPEAIDRLFEAGILVEHAPLDVIDDRPVQRAGATAFALCPAGERLPEELDPRTLRRFEIDLNRLCVAIRQANGLSGAPVERLSHRLFHLGEFSGGGLRRAVFLVRLLRDDNVVDTILTLRGRVGRDDIIMVTPTVSILTLETSRRIALEGVALVAMTESLRPEDRELFALTLPVASPAQGRNPTQARLIVDTGGGTARFDGREAVLARREFDMLVVLANEAATGGGFVERDILYSAMQGEKHPDKALATVYDEQITKSISLLRKALGETAGISAGDRKALIQVKKKVGYRLTLDRADILIL